MNTYFIRGLECTAHIGEDIWQKSVSQKLIIEIEWRPLNAQNSPSFLINLSSDFDMIIKNITELTSSKHWPSLDELTEEIKQQIQIKSEYFKITLSIPHAYAQTKSIGLTIEYP